MSGPPDFGRRTRLDAGTLGINAVTDLFGSRGMSLSELRDLQHWEATSYRVESDDPILAGVDGEALQFESPLDLTIRPKALAVLVPTGTRPGCVPPPDKITARVLDLANLGGEPEPGPGFGDVFACP